MKVCVQQIVNATVYNPCLLVYSFKRAFKTFKILEQTKDDRFFLEVYLM